MNFWRNINVMFAKKFFNVWVKLTSHVKIAHENQKIHDHKCDTCRKSFSLAWNLKTHINSVHNYQRDHKWDSCAKSFSRGGDLKKHINVVHNCSDHLLLLCSNDIIRKLDFLTLFKCMISLDFCHFVLMKTWDFFTF